MSPSREFFVGYIFVVMLTDVGREWRKVFPTYIRIVWFETRNQSGVLSYCLINAHMGCGRREKLAVRSELGGLAILFHLSWFFLGTGMLK